MEMYLAGVSVRRVEDITGSRWGMRVSAGTVSDLNQKMYERIETWRNRKIEKVYPYVYVDGISLKRTWGGERQDRLDGGPAGDLDQFIDRHLGPGDQLDHRQEELPLLAEKLRQFAAIGVVRNLVRCRVHGYSFTS